MPDTLTDEQADYLMARGLRRVTYRDPSLAHQIVIWSETPGSRIAISCNCLATRNGNGSVTHEFIEARPSWEPGEAFALWQAHAAAEGLALWAESRGGRTAGEAG